MEQGPQDNTASQRAQAVAETVEQLRVLLDSDAPTPAALAAAEAVLRTLAARQALWPAEDFPIPADRLWQAYKLHEDADGRYAVYAVPMRPGHAQPPHDHTTWALIAGVRGVERNVLYARPAAGAPAAPLVVRAQALVAAGSSLAIGPSDLHAIEVLGPGDALHLHVYGRGFGHLAGRQIFDPATGAGRPFPVVAGLS